MELEKKLKLKDKKTFYYSDILLFLCKLSDCCFKVKLHHSLDVLHPTISGYYHKRQIRNESCHQSFLVGSHIRSFAEIV